MEAVPAPRRPPRPDPPQSPARQRVCGIVSAMQVHTGAHAASGRTENLSSSSGGKLSS